MSDLAILKALELLTDKLKYRLDKHGKGSFASRHEILGIEAEEYHELVEAVRAETIDDVKEELLDVAVGAVFGVACIVDGKVEW